MGFYPNGCCQQCKKKWCKGRGKGNCCTSCANGYCSRCNNLGEENGD